MCEGSISAEKKDIANPAKLVVKNFFPSFAHPRTRMAA